LINTSASSLALRITTRPSVAARTVAWRGRPRADSGIWLEGSLPIDTSPDGMLRRCPPISSDDISIGL
jgi:hypothetical protein